MFKGYEYNKFCKYIAKKSIYEQEYTLLHEFLASKNENICFEYETRREAVNAAASLTMYIKKAKQPLLIKQRENFVFAVRKADK